MSLTLILPVALGLSTDAFAVAVSKGTQARTRELWASLKIGALFGAFEGGMCLAGWVLAASLASLVVAVDHWIALILLAGIGGKMIREGMTDEEDAQGDADPPSRSVLVWLLTAIGTSVDSAAVGIAFALSGVSILLAAPIIAVISMAASFSGYLLGPSLGERFGRRAEIAGGLVLIAIGISIFLSHILDPAHGTGF